MRYSAYLVVKIKFHRLTQIFDEPEHDPSDVKIALNPQRPFHLQIGHVDLQVPRTVADDETVGGGHLIAVTCANLKSKMPKKKKKTNRNQMAVLLFIAFSKTGGIAVTGRE